VDELKGDVSMKFHNLVAAAAALTLTATPVIAQAASAEISRVSAPATDESEMGGGNSLMLILAALLIGAGIFLLADGNGNKPASP
jgi:predicted transporter